MNQKLTAISNQYKISDLSTESFQKALEQAYLLGHTEKFKSETKYKNNEELYDEEIAPLLKLVADRCTEEKMPLVAVVEYDEGKTGTTSFLPENAYLGMIMVNHCAKMGVNIDGYIIGLLKYAKSKGIDYSGSIVMKHIAGEK